MSSAKTALLAGASGLVGRELLKVLLNAPEYAQVTVLVRRELPIQHAKLRQVVTDFDHLDAYAEHFRVDDVFCTLGTTIKIAKTREAFEKVDYTYPLRLAELAKEQGAKNYLIITALGSDADSSIFYNQVKGRVERDIQARSLPALRIFRPSLLLGDRQEFRLGERFASLFTWAMIGPLKKYKPIHARTVANAMYKVAQQPASGTYVFKSDHIQALGS